MDPITRAVASAAAGAASSDATYVDDVFSTFLYDGIGGTQTITNGIDLSGEGGLVWIKRRDGTHGHRLTDTERGATKALESDTDTAEATHSTGLTAFNSDGFSLGSNSKYNGNGYEMCSWSFRKAPGFFDVVTYTGNGTAGRTISHNLGSVPGMILLKQTSNTARWFVYHRSTGNGNQLTLNATNAAYSTSAWNSTTPTSTVFTLNDGTIVNGNGETYVAYLFAHDDQSFGTNGDESIIKCGSYTGNGGYQKIDIGFEVQWALIKRSSADGDWGIFDIMRGAPGGDNIQSNGSVRLRPNTTQAEGGSGVGVHSSGFILGDGSSEINTSGVTYIYMAIRRPNKPPSAGTDVFKAVKTTTQPFSVGFPTDLAINKPTGTGSNYWVPRLTNGYLASNATNQESAGGTYFKFDLQNSYSLSNFWGSNETINWQFRRAPGFMDVVAYEGTGSAHTQTHNLEVAPELYIMKGRDYSGNWVVITTALGNSTQYAYLNSTQAFGSTSWTLPTSTGFYVSNSVEVNNSGSQYIAYLFASLNGISKVGTYSGTGYAVNVDCGFSAGARLVMIKRTDGTGGWFVWDTARGIVSGNDPYLLWNSNLYQVTNTDYIDPLNAGFTVTSSAPAALNANGGTYLFLAIA